MTSVIIDALSIAKRLKSRRFSEMQAEAIAFEIQENTQDGHLVTKAYLDEKLYCLEKLELHMTARMAVMLTAAK